MAKKKRKRGRPKKHKNITVSQRDNYNEYHRQYHEKIWKYKRLKDNWKKVKM